MRRSDRGVMGLGLLFVVLAGLGAKSWWNAPAVSTQKTTRHEQREIREWGEEFPVGEIEKTPPLTTKQKNEIAFNKRLTEYRKRKHAMPNDPNVPDIAKGTTGQAKLIAETVGNPGIATAPYGVGEWWHIKKGGQPISNGGTSTTRGPLNPQEWAVTDSGVITVPASTSAGIYDAVWSKNESTSNGNYVYTQRQFTFEVVKFSIKVTAQVTGKNADGTYNVDWGRIIRGTPSLPVSDLWDTGATTASWTGIGAGEHTDTVTDAAGDSASDTLGIDIGESADMGDGVRIAHVEGVRETTLPLNTMAHWTADPVGVQPADVLWDAEANDGQAVPPPFSWQKSYPVAGDYSHSIQGEGDGHVFYSEALLHVYDPDNPSDPNHPTNPSNPNATRLVIAADPISGASPLGSKIKAFLLNPTNGAALRDYTLSVDGVAPSTKNGSAAAGVFWDEVFTVPPEQSSKQFTLSVVSGEYSATSTVTVYADASESPAPFLRLGVTPPSGDTPLRPTVAAHIENAADPAALIDFVLSVDGAASDTQNRAAGSGATFFPSLTCPEGQTSKTYLVAVEAGNWRAAQSVTVYRASSSNPPPPNTPPSDTTRLALEVVPGTGETPLSTQIRARFLDAPAPASTQEFKTYVDGVLEDVRTQAAGQGIELPYMFALPANLTAKNFLVRVESGGYAATQSVTVRRIAPPATGSPSLRVVAVPTSGKSPLSTQLNARIDNAANPSANTSFEYFLDGVSQGTKSGAASSGVSWNVPLQLAAGKTSQTFALRVTSGSLEETQNVTAYQSGVGDPGDPPDPPDPPGVIYRCPAPPAAPAAPTLQGIDCGAHSVTLKSPDFPADNATRPDPTRDVLLWRLPKDGNPNAGAHFVGLFAATGATLTDDGVISPNAYDYYAQARNERGLSEYSAKLAVSLASPLTVEFLAPANETLRGWQQVAVKVQGSGVGIGAVHVFYNGSELTMQPSSADASVFWCDFDTDADARQGTSVFSAYVVDANGCRSPLVEAARVLDNSLRSDVRWLEVRRTWEQVAAGVQLYAKLLPPGVTGSADDCAIEFGVFSPAPTTPLPTETPYTQAQLDALDADWLNWKKILLDAPTSVPRANEPNAKGEYSQAARMVALRARCQRLRRVSRFPVESPIERFVVQEAKAAQGTTPATPARLLAYSTMGARIYEYSESVVWKRLYDLSTQFPNAHSVAMRADKIYFVNEGRAVAYDVNVGEAAYTGVAMGETKEATACEYWPGADAIVWAHGNLHDGSTLWLQTGDQVKKLADDLPFVSLLRTAGDTLAFLTDFSVWTVQKGGVPIERYTSLAEAAMFVSPQTSGDVIFSSDKTWLLQAGASTPLLLDDRDFIVTSYATHGQSVSTPLPVIGGLSTQLYRREPVAPDQAAFVPFLNLEAGEEVRALASLKFGDVDTLFVSIDDGESGHVLRVQSIAPAPGSYRARDIEHLVLSPTQYV